MVDENIKDQFVKVSNVARILAKDSSFVSEIGLDEFQPDQIVQGLELIFSFILSMYNTAKTIFSIHKSLGVDDKFVNLIYSHFLITPCLSKNTSDALNYAKEFYEDIKRKANQSNCKWDDMSLHEKFFETCAHVLIEENVAIMRMVNRPKDDTGADTVLVTRPVLAVAFKGFFSYVSWDLDGVETRPLDTLFLSLAQKWRSKNTVNDWISTKGEIMFIYMLHKDGVKQDIRMEFSPEEAFWLEFILISFDIGWDNNSKVEVNLSEVLMLYLKIYREDIKPEMTPEEEVDFLEILKERFYKVEKLLFDRQGIYVPVFFFKLSRLILVENANNLFKQYQAGLITISAANARSKKPIPFKLVKDV